MRLLMTRKRRSFSDKLSESIAVFERRGVRPKLSSTKPKDPAKKSFNSLSNFWNLTGSELLVSKRLER